MYNGIGLTTARGSGTNGFVTRNLSTVRKTKEKVPEYSSKDDAAVRPFDIELIEHERRRQAEVRCLELQELLEEQEIPEEEIMEKVNAFRAKLLAERKSGIARDSSGRPIVNEPTPSTSESGTTIKPDRESQVVNDISSSSSSKPVRTHRVARLRISQSSGHVHSTSKSKLKDSHEVSMAQEAKNEKAKDAFGIRADFVPGSSMVSNNSNRTEKAVTGEVTLEAPKPVEKSKVEKEKKKKRSHKRRASTSSSSSSSSGTSSDEETRRKRKKKDKKKKSKKSHHHHKRDDRSRSREKDRTSPVVCGCENDASSSSSFGCLTQYSIHSSSTEDEETDDQLQLTSCLATIVNLTTNGVLRQSSSPIEIISLPMNYPHSASPNNLSPSPEFLPIRIQDCSARSKSPSLHSQYSRSSTRSRSPGPARPKNKSLSPPQRYRSKSRSKSRSLSGSNLSRSSGSDRSRSRSANHSQPESRQHSRSNSVSSHSTSSSSTKSNKTRSRSSSRSVSIPRRRGSPSFLDRRRITSARKRPIPYKRREGSEYDVSTSSGSGAADTDSESDFSDY